MAAIGADPEALLDLANRFASLARQLDRTSAGLGQIVRRSRWSGLDAERFQRAWSLTHQSALRTASQSITGCSGALRQQAAEQRNASANSGPVSIAGSTVLPRPSGPGSSWSSFPIANFGLGHPPNGSIPLRPRAGLDSQPISVLHLAAGSSLTFASLITGFTHDVSIAEHKDGTSRVTLSRTEAIGANATAGAAFHLGGVRAVGASAGGQATVGWVVRDEYLVRNSGVWPLVTAVEAESAAGRLRSASKRSPILGPAAMGIGSAISAGRSVLGRLPVVGETVSSLSALDLTPRPRRTERLVELSVSASGGIATLGVLGPKTGSESTFVARLGRATDNGALTNGRASTILELDGAAAASLHAKMLGRTLPEGLGDHEAMSDWKLRIELPDTPTQGRELTVTTVQTEGDLLRETRTSVDLSDAKLIPAGLGPALVELNKAGRTPSVGDATKVMAHLSDVRLTGAQVTTTSSAMAVTSSRSAGLGAEAGAGASIGAELVLEAERLGPVG